jgi:hypothetical protein
MKGGQSPSQILCPLPEVRTQAKVGPVKHRYIISNFKDLVKGKMGSIGHEHPADEKDGEGLPRT